MIVYYYVCRVFFMIIVDVIFGFGFLFLLNKFSLWRVLFLVFGFYFYVNIDIEFSFFDFYKNCFYFFRILCVFGRFY